MSKKEIIKNIEDGLLNFYTTKDEHLYQQAMAEEGVNINESTHEYEMLARQILFKAQAMVNEQQIARVINIIQKTKSPSYVEDDKPKVISIFNKHIREHGLAVNYRNLDEMDIEEIKDILAQIDLTSIINDLMSQNLYE